MGRRPWIQVSRHVTGRHGDREVMFHVSGLSDEEIVLELQRTKHFWLCSRACCLGDIILCPVHLAMLGKCLVLVMVHPTEELQTL